MAQIPSVCIDPHINLTTEISDVHIPVALVGVEVEGCAYRMDNVPIACRKVVEPPEGMLTDELCRCTTGSVVSWGMHK